MGATEQPGVKFACLALSTNPRADLPEQHTQIGHGYEISGRGSILGADDWERSIGELEFKRLRRADLVVWVKKESRRANVFDPETEALVERLWRFWEAVLMHHPPRIMGAWFLAGSLAGSVNNYRTSPTVYVKHRYEQLSRLTLERCQAAAATAAQLERQYANDGIKGRLERGICAFKSAMLAGTIDESILGLERALEGLLQPSKPAQLVPRGDAVINDLSNPGGSARGLLNAIREVRNQFTHCATVEETFPGLTREQAVARGQQLQAALYQIVSRAYTSVLASDPLVDQFSQYGLGPWWGRVVQGREPSPFQIDLDPTSWQ